MRQHSADARVDSDSKQGAEEARFSAVLRKNRRVHLHARLSSCGVRCMHVRERALWCPATGHVIIVCVYLALAIA